MPAADAFHQTIDHLLRSKNIVLNRDAAAQLGYTIREDEGLFIDLIGLQPGQLNLRSVVGTLPAHAQRGSVLRLLQANQFGFEHPPVSVGIDDQTFAVTVWSRQALAELAADHDCLWYLRFVQIASLIRQWLLGADHLASANKLLLRR